MKKSLACICLFWPSLSFTETTQGSDWPTYLHDNTRAGWTTDELTLPLQQRWVESAPTAPRRAWAEPEGRVVEGKNLRDRVRFDDSFAVAVVGDRVYFGSSVDHQVHCLDVGSGKRLWSYFTAAPVRLAPMVADGRVYAGSDDGHVYCLDAAAGRLMWQLRLGPADEWMIGRGELISRWPVRTGVLIEDGVAYFGAGIFPHENVYLCAADAQTGKVIWRNDHISHEDAGREDLSPQGYMLSDESQLYVPSNRARHRGVQPQTGKLIGAGGVSLQFFDTVVAGTEALIVDGKLHSYTPGTPLAHAGTSSYAATGTHVMSLKLAEFAAANTTRTNLNAKLADLSRKLNGAGDKAAELKAEIADLQKQRAAIENNGILWKTPCVASSALIVAGNHVFVGGKNQVFAYDAAAGKEAWTANVDGDARGLAVASDHLLVSTTTGRVYCFGDSASGPQPAVAESTAKQPPNPYPQDEATALYEHAADEIVKHSQVQRGYCLIVGSEHGRLAYELAKRTELKIYGIEPDAEKVEASRRALAAVGLYGHRVTIHQADLADIPYSNYFANLIVSDRLLLSEQLPGEARQIVRHLKPAGGVICLGRPATSTLPAVTAPAVSSWLRGVELGDNSTVTAADSWVVATRGTLVGAGNWTHQYAEPGNTANSGDKLVQGGMGVLWYGDPGPDKMVNRHDGAVGPLVVNGRMFVQGTDSLMAYDAYNGLFLWEVANPDAIRTGVFENQVPGNLAASDSSVFNRVQDRVYEHDSATGAVKATHHLPPTTDQAEREWGYLAYRDGLLFGTATVRKTIEMARRRRGNPGAAATDILFAVDTPTGKLLWTYQGKSIEYQTIALGFDRVFLIDSTVTSEQRDEILRQDKTELKSLTGEDARRAEERLKRADVRTAVALDARTGKPIWSQAVDVTDCSEVGTGAGKLTMMYRDGVLMLCGANANGHYWKQFVSGEFKQRRLVALSALEGYKLWAKDANYRHRPIIVGDRVIAEPWSFDLFSGEQNTRAHPLTGQDVPWSIMRPGHHCGMLTACDNLLLFRSGYTGFYDLQADAGTQHFAGHRLGCWINAIPTNGLVVIPEASAGCICMFSIASTIVMEPREQRRPWSLFSGVGSTTPVQQMTLNFGAPGDRRDARGKLWLAYPRPVPNARLETSLDLAFKLDIALLPQGELFSRDGDAIEASGSETAWITSSGYRGLARCSLPLLGKDDPPAVYSVRLYFAGDEADKPNQRVFDVRVQGKLVSENVDAASGSNGGAQDSDGFAVTLEVKDVTVTDNLVVELIPKVDPPDRTQMPILCGIDVQKTGPTVRDASD